MRRVSAASYTPYRSFSEIVNLIRKYTTKEDNVMRRAISFPERLELHFVFVQQVGALTYDSFILYIDKAQLFRICALAGNSYRSCLLKFLSLSFLDKMPGFTHTDTHHTKTDNNWHPKCVVFLSISGETFKSLAF